MGDREKMIALAIDADRRETAALRQEAAFRRQREYALAREEKGKANAFETEATLLRLALNMSQSDLRVEARVLGLIDTDAGLQVERERTRLAIRGRYPVVVGGVDTGAPAPVLGDAETYAQAPQDEREEDAQANMYLG